MGIADMIFELIDAAVTIGKGVAASSAADQAALDQRLKDSLAALKGEKTAAHAALDARWASLVGFLASKGAE